MTTARPLPTFGHLLRRYRMAEGLTQEALARRARLSVRGISDLERGVRQTPRRDTIMLLAEALCLSAPEQAAFETAARMQPPPFVSSFNLSPQSLSPALPLVGRSGEQRALARHLSGDSPRALLLTGDPGIGKTRLLHEAAIQARMLGMTVVDGGCHRGNGQEPYAPVLGALARRISRTPKARLQADLQGCDWLVRLLPELTAMKLASLPEWALSPEQERRLMFAAVARFLANIASPTGILLLLDDLQWAGADALDLVASLLRTEDATPLRLVAAYRDTEVHVQHPLAIMLADLAHDGVVAPLALGPLPPVDAATLVELVLGDGANQTAQVDRVVHRAGGVPFYLISCAQALCLGAPDQDGQVGAEEKVPWQVTQTIRQRLAALPQVAQELLAAAVILDRATISLLFAITLLPEADILSSLDRANAARLLVEVEEGQYAFAHDLIRDVVASYLGTARRKLLHLRAAEALERQPEHVSVELLAYHYGRSEDHEKAILYLEQAGDKARDVHANADAERYYRDLAAHFQKLGRATQEASALDKLGSAFLSQSRFDQAIVAFERAVTLYRIAGEQEASARVVANIAKAHSLRGEPEKAIMHLRQGLSDLSEITLGSQAFLYGQLTYPLYRIGRYEEALIAAEQATECARSANESILLLHGEIRRGFTLGSLGRLREAKCVLEAVLAQTQVDGSNDEILQATLTHLGVTCASLGEYTLSQQYAERALVAAERLHNPDQILLSHSNCGWSAYLLGAWEQARTDLEHALTMIEDAPTSWATPYALLNLGILYLAEGGAEVALDYIARGLALAEQGGDLQLMCWAQQELAEADLLEGRPQMALARLEPLLVRPDPSRASATTIDMVGLLPPLAWAYLELADEKQAATLLMLGLKRTRTAQLRATTVSLLRVWSLLAIRLQRWATAEAALRRALVLAQAMPSPYDEAKVLYVYGLLYLQRGESELARHHLEESLATCMRLGERLYAGHVEQALGRLG